MELYLRPSGLLRTLTQNFAAESYITPPGRLRVNKQHQTIDVLFSNIISVVESWFHSENKHVEISKTDDIINGNIQNRLLERTGSHFGISPSFQNTFGHVIYGSICDRMQTAVQLKNFTLRSAK